MSLVYQLNQLLIALHIDIPSGIRSPAELTPSLLLAILECLLNARLPITPELRRSKDHDLKMKIFLGVLETDILKSDNMGLSTVDPRRLARGEWNEVVHVGEVLCWIGRTIGLIKDDASDRGTSPTATTTTTTTTTKKTESAPTTVDDQYYGEDDGLPPSVAPRCIHEIPSPLVTLSPSLHPDTNRWEDQSISDPFLLSLDAKISPPVRYSGVIATADEEWEIASFESAHSSSSYEKSLDILNDEQPPQRTLALLRERARLLVEIARLEAVGG